MKRHAASPPRGILRAQAVNGEHQRWLPRAELADVVEHFWFVSWDQTQHEPVTVSTLPHPSVHLIFEQGKLAEMAGVQRRRFVRTLSDRGQVFGVKFRPAGFFPFCGFAQNQLCDRVVALSQIWPDNSADLVATLQQQIGGEQTMQAAEAFLCGRQRVENDEWLSVRNWIELARDNRELLKVEQLAQSAGLSVRQLQRQFLRYAGVSPKWIIQRYRLHEVLASIDRAPMPDWAALSMQLGYSDQAHFIRDFRASTGMTPQQYSRLTQPV